MSTIATIANWNIVAFGLLLLAALMLVHEACYWLGGRYKARGADVHAEGVGVVVGGMLGLLAFVLALVVRQFPLQRARPRDAQRGQRDRYRVVAGRGDRSRKRTRNRKTVGGILTSQKGVRDRRTRSGRY